MTRTGRFTALGLGVSFAAAAVMGRAAMFVRGWFVPVVLATGAVLVFAAFRERIHLSRKAAALLLVPVAVGVFLTPGLVGRQAASEASGPLPSRLFEGSNPLLGNGGGTVTVLDIALAAREVGAVLLDGRAVTVDGTVAQDNRISRMVMVCCAADARPVSIPVVGALGHEGDWVEVTGRLTARGDRVVLRATRVRSIPTPSDPFL
jgi:hypothetical protein